MPLTDSLIMYLCNKSWRLMNRLNFTAEVHHAGKVLKVPVRGGVGRVHLAGTPTELVDALRVAQSTGQEGGVFVDVGANMGQGLVAAIAAGVTKYLGFEPDLEAAAYVRSLIRSNGLQEATILPLALSHQDGIAQLHTRSEVGFVGATLNTGMTPGQMYSTHTQVFATTGDNQLSGMQNGEILLTKIDVEGHELAVLQGLSQTLQRTRCPVYCEVLGYDHFLDGTYGRDYFLDLTEKQVRDLCNAREENGRRVAEFFHHIGYQLFEIGSELQLEPIQQIPLSDSRPGQQGERNVLALPAEQC